MPADTIDELKARLAKAEEERDFFRDTLNALPTTVSVVKPNGTIVWANEILLKLSQATLEQVIGVSAYDRPEIPEADAALTKSLVDGVVAGNPVGMREYPAGTVDGNTIWALLIMTPITRNGKAEYVVNNALNITDRKKAEDELRQAKLSLESAINELLNSNKLKDQFVSLVSHDLRSPLGNVMGMLEALKGKVGAKLQPDEMFYLNRAIANCNALLGMIQRLLDISRLQSGKMKLRKRFIDVRPYLMDIVESLAHLAAEKGIRISVDIPEKMRILADDGLLHQVVHNLAGNAVKFLRQGDRLTIHSVDGQAGVIAFTDDGPGINAERIPNLFTHEARTSTTGTRGEKGMGLGLPMCADIMRAHGGSITAASQAGKGTVFTLTLPQARALALVVDDQEAARQEMAEHIRAMGAEALEAADGREAMSIIEETMPQVVITDVMMPVMDGWELLKMIRQIYPPEALPVIVMTSSGQREAREVAFRLGANDFAQKPVIADDFVPRVKRFIG